MKPLSDTTLSQQQTEQQRVADEQARLDSCRKALESLKEVNPKQADKLGNEFTALLSAATQYNSVRSKVAEPTKRGSIRCTSSNQSSYALILKRH